jgi:hypothetical protein
LSEALASEGPFDWVVLRFAEYHVFMKLVHSSYLAIIVDRGANLPALKMAASLVAKRLPPASGAPGALVEGGAREASLAPGLPTSEPPPTVASVPAARRAVAPPEARSLPPSSAARARIFRGRRVDS